jgi:hypothetical protein
MDEPLIPIEWLLYAWAVVGAVVAVALTILALIFIKPPLTTQTNRVTGEKRHGILLWYVGFTAAGVGIPFAILLVRAMAAPAAWLMAHWWLFLAAGAVATLVWGGWHLWQTQRAADKDELEVEQEWVPELPHNPIPTAPVQPVQPPQQVVGWSLPTDAPHWAERP